MLLNIFDLIEFDHLHFWKWALVDPEDRSQVYPVLTLHWAYLEDLLLELETVPNNPLDLAVGIFFLD